MWSNPIVGGGNTLIRDSIHSPDYVAGISGWTINKDGSAEFNDVNVRGTFTVVGTDGSYVSLDIIGGVPLIALHPGQPDPPNGHTYYRGSIFTVKNPGVANMQYLEIEGPQVDLLGTGKIVINGTKTDGTAPLIYMGPSSYGGFMNFTMEGYVTITRSLTIGVDLHVDDDVFITDNATIDGTLTAEVWNFPLLRKSANQDFTNTVAMADITDMSFSAVANGVYRIEGRYAIGGPTAADVRLAWTVPAGATMARNVLAAATGLASNDSTSVAFLRRGATTQQQGGTSGGAVNDFTGYWEDILLFMGATAGTVQLQGAQGTANATPTRFTADSYAVVTRLS